MVLLCFENAKAEIDKVLIKELPQHCRTNSHSVWHQTKSYIAGFLMISTDECLEYQKALHATPYTKATFTQVVRFYEYFFLS
jgi:hypothetical protein